jgi:hypothetical protein
MAGATPGKDSEATARPGCRAEETERREENEEDEGEVRELVLLHGKRRRFWLRLEPQQDALLVMSEISSELFSRDKALFHRGIKHVSKWAVQGSACKGASAPGATWDLNATSSLTFLISNRLDIALGTRYQILCPNFFL